MDALNLTRLLKIWAKSSAIIPSWHLDFRNKEVYEKLKEGYQILMQNTPESTLFEEYLREETTKLLDDAIAIIEEEKKAKVEEKVDFIRYSWAQLFFPAKSFSPLMTYEVR